LRSRNHDTRFSRTRTSRRETHVETDNGTANFIAIDQHTNKIYVSQYWDGTVWVIDGDSDQVVGVINGVGVAAAPDDCYLPANNDDCTNQYSGLDHIAVDETLRRAYVLGTNDGRFVTIDTEKNQVISTKFIGSNQYDAAVNPFTHTVYSISDLFDTLAVIDGKTDRPVAENILVGSPPSPPGCLTSTTGCTNYGDLPQSIAVNPTTGKIYVADPGDTFSNPEAVSHIVILKAREGHPWVSPW